MTRYVKFMVPYLLSFDFRVLQMFRIWKNIIKSSLATWSIWLEMGNRILNFEHDTLCEVQGSISSIFWLQGPPDVLYLTEYYEIIIIIMINVIRNGIYDNRKGFWISNVTRYVKFKAPYLPSFDFKFLQMSCI